MLAEKFILALETLIRSRTYPDGSPRVASTSPHVPVKCRIEPAFRAPSRLQPIAACWNASQQSCSKFA